MKWVHPRWLTTVEKVRELAPLWYRKGYYKVQFNSCGKTRAPSRQFVHRVIYQTFHGDIPQGLTVNHIDGSHNNNHADNLNLLTPQEQVHHAIGQGKLVGKRKSPSPMTQEIVADIRRILAATPAPTNRMRDVLAARYGVSNSLIRFIELRSVWEETGTITPDTMADRCGSR